MGGLMPEYAYRYTKGGKPLLQCPECGGDLTMPDGIDLVLSVADHVFTVPSSLDNEGNLADDRGQVAAGHHSVTECGHF
jgi:hypothetical protein